MARAIKEHLEEPTIKGVPINEVRSCILFDLMAYARKVPVKTDHVLCFGDFAEHIWNTFTRLSDNSKRIDIVFDFLNNGFVRNMIKTFHSTLKAVFLVT